MTAVNVASTYLGFRWIDKFGRRKLAIGGYAGMTIFTLVAALGLTLLSGTPWPASLPCASPPPHSCVGSY